MRGRERLRRVEVGGRSLAVAEHEASGHASVVFCHGFRGERTGPNRTFVTAARALAARGVRSVRFDQYGSGDSDGDFAESRFDDWIAAIDAIARRELDADRRVALLGQSMGASASLMAAPDLPVEAVVAWVPDANVDPYRPDGSGFMEEGGQRVADAFWEQAHAADVPGSLGRLAVPSLLVLATDDEHVSRRNREALLRAARPEHRVEVLEGHRHSAWTSTQAAAVIERSTAFLLDHLGGPRSREHGTTRGGSGVAR